MITGEKVITFAFPYPVGEISTPCRRDFHTICRYLVGGESRLSEALADIDKVRPEDLDKEILRAAMIAELDAINIYEQMANLTKNEEIHKILLEVARKEKIHVAMLETVLLQTDREFLKIYSDYALTRAKR
jgi:rubrerythrin